MYKIRKVDFLNHPILGNLSLNFCDANGHAVDTVIFAGENGVGKSTILNALYELITQKLNLKPILNMNLENELLTSNSTGKNILRATLSYNSR